MPSRQGRSQATTRPTPGPRARDRGAAVRRGPGADYQPQSGRLTTFEIPVEDGIRVDTGFATGSVVSTHYDAMLAKVIAHAPTRRAGGAQAGRGALPGPDPRPGHQPRPARGDPAGRGVPRRGGEHGVPGGGRGLEARWRSHLDQRGWPGAAVAAAIALAERAGAARTVQSRIPVAWRNVVVAAAGDRASRATSRSRGTASPSTATVVDGLQRSSRLDRLDRRPRGGDARDRRRADDVRRERSTGSRSTSTARTATCGSPGCRGSSTRPTPWRAAACWLRCPARS